MLANGSSQSSDIQELKEVDIGFSMVVDNINNGIKIMLIIF